jgi:uncharacterized membrane protein YfcA
MMPEYLHQYHLSPVQWAIAIAASVILGISKAGINAVSIVTVTMLAHVFGSRTSTGILLPMLITADILAVWHYKRHTQWPYLVRMLPWMVAGVLLGTWFGKDLDESLFKKVMAGVILFTVAMMIWFDQKKQVYVPAHWAFAGSLGLSAGFTSMVGNLAGGFSNIYFLSMRLSKVHLIGTSAWLFMLVNTFKLPFHIFAWKTVNADSIGINLSLLPFLIIGFFTGIRIVRVMAEERYRQMILWLTAIGVVVMLFF